MDLYNFLRDNSTIISERESFNILKTYDLNGDGKLSYTEFMNAILPAANLMLRNLASSRSAISSYMMPYDVEIAVARVWQRELDLNKTLEIQK